MLAWTWVSRLQRTKTADAENAGTKQSKRQAATSQPIVCEYFFSFFLAILLPRCFKKIDRTDASSGGKHCRRKWTTIDLPDSCLISSPLFLLVRKESLLSGAVTVGACLWVKHPQVKRCTLTPSYRRKPLLYTRASWVVLLEEGNCSPVIFFSFYWKKKKHCKKWPTLHTA